MNSGAWTTVCRDFAGRERTLRVVVRGRKRFHNAFRPAVTSTTLLGGGSHDRCHGASAVERCGRCGPLGVLVVQDVVRMPIDTAVHRHPRHAVVIASGGLDSTVLAYWLAARGAELTLLSFDYGQRHRVELEHAADIARSNT